MLQRLSPRLAPLVWLPDATTIERGVPVRVIRFDDAARAVTLSVRDIADPGDHRFTGPSAVGLKKRAEMGRDAHEVHQGAREDAVSSYRRERSVRYETEVDGWRVVVVGRIDGVYSDASGRTVVEEVKTVLASPDALGSLSVESYPAYARQLQLYRFLLEEGASGLDFDGASGRAGAPQIALHLCFIALPSSDRRTVEVGYEREACRQLVRTRLSDLVREHEELARRRAERRQRRGTVHFPFPATRSHQDTMMDAIGKALRERRPILVSAPPGTGKTAATLVPALRHAFEIGGRVFIATSKTTQQKIFAETVKKLKEAGTPVRSVVLVAKEKACLNDVVLCHPDACRYARDYHAKLELSGALERLSRLPIADMEAVRDEAKKHEFCPFEAALDLTSGVDVIIGDYNYVFDPQAALKRMFVDESPEDVILVIDEAHNLYERGAEYYSPELSRVRVRDLERELAGSPDPIRRRIRGLLRSLDEHLAAVEAGVRPVARRERPTEKLLRGGEAKAAPDVPPPTLQGMLFRDPEAEAEERRRASARLARLERDARTQDRRQKAREPEAPEPGPEAWGDASPQSEPAATPPLHHVPPEREVTLDKGFFLSLRDELDELMVSYFLERRAQGVLGAQADPLVDFQRSFGRFASVLELEGDDLCTLYRRTGGGALKVLCKDPSRQLGKRIRACAGTIAVSATLEPLEFYRDVLGFPRDETELRAFPSPFPRERRAVVVLDKPSTHYKDRDRDLPIVEDAIRAVVAARSGNYIACFPSFEYLEMCAPRLTSLPGYEVVKQERRMSDAERAAVLDRLKEFHPGGARLPVLLLAVQGGAFTEGVDYPGEMCIGAIVVGPGLPRWSFERELVRAHFERSYGKGFEYAYLFPGMSRVIQAAGRVIRTATDAGIVALVGDRFATERYASLFPRDWYVRHPRELVTRDPYGALRRFWSGLEEKPRLEQDASLRQGSG